jgi:hypothetical protein
MATPKTGKVLTRAERPFGQSRPSHYVETKKMVAFLCPEGVHNGIVPASREDCEAQGHDPYFSMREVETRRPKLVERDGKTFKEGEEVEIEQLRIPNWEQVVHDIANDSGQIVNRRVREGWLFPEDLGYAPFCDYLGCSIQNPKFHTPVGNYHHRDEAALMMLAKGGSEESLEGTAIFIDDTTSGDRRRQQLDTMSARFGA